MKKIGKSLLTNHSSFELVKTGHRYYFVVGAWLSNFCRGIATLWAQTVKNRVSKKKGESCEIRGRKVKKKWFSGNKESSCHFFWKPNVLLRFLLASTRLWSLQEKANSCHSLHSR